MDRELLLHVLGRDIHPAMYSTIAASFSGKFSTYELLRQI